MEEAGVQPKVISDADLEKFSYVHCRLLLAPLMNILGIPLDCWRMAGSGHEKFAELARTKVGGWGSNIIRFVSGGRSVSKQRAADIVVDAIANDLTFDDLTASVHEHTQPPLRGWDYDHYQHVRDAFYSANPMCTTPIHHDYTAVKNNFHVMPTTLAGMLLLMYSTDESLVKEITAVVNKLETRLGNALLFREPVTGVPALLWAMIWPRKHFQNHRDTLIINILNDTIAQGQVDAHGWTTTVEQNRSILGWLCGMRWARTQISHEFMVMLDSVNFSDIIHSVANDENRLDNCMLCIISVASSTHEVDYAFRIITKLTHELRQPHEDDAGFRQLIRLFRHIIRISAHLSYDTATDALNLVTSYDVAANVLELVGPNVFYREFMYEIVEHICYFAPLDTVALVIDAITPMMNASRHTVGTKLKIDTKIIIMEGTLHHVPQTARTSMVESALSSASIYAPDVCRYLIATAMAQDATNARKKFARWMANARPGNRFDISEFIIAKNANCV